MVFPFWGLWLWHTERVMQLAQDPFEDPSGDLRTLCVFKIQHCPLSQKILSAIQQDTRPNKKRKKGAGENTSLAQMGYLKVFGRNRKETVSTSSFTGTLEALTWGEDIACLGTADFHIQVMLPSCCKESSCACEVKLVCHDIEKYPSKKKSRVGCKSEPQSPS